MPGGKGAAEAGLGSWRLGSGPRVAGAAAARPGVRSASGRGCDEEGVRRLIVDLALRAPDVGVREPPSASGAHS